MAEENKFTFFYLGLGIGAVARQREQSAAAAEAGKQAYHETVAAPALSEAPGTDDLLTRP